MSNGGVFEDVFPCNLDGAVMMMLESLIAFVDEVK
jgi:hypothetical protein